jgi:hypothetical protein
MAPPTHFEHDSIGYSLLPYASRSYAADKNMYVMKVNVTEREREAVFSLYERIPEFMPGPYAEIDCPNLFPMQQFRDKGLTMKHVELFEVHHVLRSSLRLTLFSQMLVAAVKVLPGMRVVARSDYGFDGRLMYTLKDKTALKDNTCDEAVRLVVLPKKGGFEAVDPVRKETAELRRRRTSTAELLASTIQSLVSLDRSIFCIPGPSSREHLYALNRDEETKAQMRADDPSDCACAGVSKQNARSMAEGLKELARLVSADGAAEAVKQGYAVDPICHLRASWVREVEEGLDRVLAGPSLEGAPPPSPAPPLSQASGPSVAVTPSGGGVEEGRDGSMDGLADPMDGLAEAVWGAVSPGLGPRTPASDTSPLPSQSPSVLSLDDASLHVGGMPLRKSKGAARAAKARAPALKKGRATAAPPSPPAVALPRAAKRVRLAPGGSERVAGGPSRPLVPKAMKMARSRSSGK